MIKLDSQHMKALWLKTLSEAYITLPEGLSFVYVPTEAEQLKREITILKNELDSVKESIDDALDEEFGDKEDSVLSDLFYKINILGKNPSDIVNQLFIDNGMI